MSVPSTLTHVHAPCLQTCCLADFQIRKRPDKGRSADWEVGDTAGLETCVTSSYLRPPALREREPRRRPLDGAFTLVEVILAMGMAIGLLVVALYFHGQ